MALIQGHKSKVIVTDRKSAKFVSGPYLPFSVTLRFLFSHKGCLLCEGVS